MCMPELGVVVCRSSAIEGGAARPEALARHFAARVEGASDVSHVPEDGRRDVWVARESAPIRTGLGDREPICRPYLVDQSIVVVLVGSAFAEASSARLHDPIRREWRLCQRLELRWNRVDELLKRGRAVLLKR